MPDYERSLTMRARPDDVLAFVSDIRNMPRYMPTTKQAEDAGPERVHVAGEANGHPYDAEGYLRRKDGGLEWGADEGGYSGWLKVRPEGDSTAVTIGISLRGVPPGADPAQTPSDDDINEGLRKGLESIKNQVEGTGGKVEPAAAA